MPKCANPLFLRWVKEFHDEKDYRKRGGPPRATGYENAVRALEMCTQTYAHPADMRGKVSGVGPTTIERLTEKLEEYCERRAMPMPEPTPKPARGRKAVAAKPKTPSKAKVEKAESDDEDFTPTKRKRTQRKAAASKAKVKHEEDEEDEPEDDDEYEDKPPPKKRARRMPKKTQEPVEIIVREVEESE